MKKKNWLKLICSICLVVFATLTLTACGGAENPVSSSPEGGGYQSGSSSPSVNIPGSDSSTSSKDPSDSSSSEEPPEVEEVDFSQYFSGYVVLTNGNSTYTVEDENGNQVLFNDLLDRQFDILAQDLIYRLTYVYGYNESTHNRTGASEQFELKKIDGTSYTYNDKKALVSNNNLLATTPSHTSHSVSSMDVSCIDCYQLSLDNTADGSSRFMHVESLYLAGAIEGRFLSVGGINGDELLNTATSNKWAMAATKTTYSEYLTQYKNKFKMALAQIIAEKPVDGNYSETSYNTLLASINTLGFYTGESEQKEAVVEFINNNVIGTTIINNDEQILDSYFASSKIINSSFGSDTLHAYPNSPRYYKGYSVVVPAIVDQAFANTFDQTTTSIYPHFSRVNGSKGTFETYTITSKDQNGEDTEVQELTTTGALNLNSIILKPQEGAAPLSLELQIDVARALTDDYPSGMSVGDAGYINYFARDIVVELEVDITYKVGDTIVKISKAIADEADGSSIITLDSKTGYIMKQLDYNDPNFDPTRIDEEGYADQFMKPVQSENGTILPYEYTYSLYESFPDEKVIPLTKYSGFDPDTDKNTLWNNKFVKDDENEMIYLDAGTSYIQINFNIVSIKKYGGDNNSQLTDYIGNDIVFDITVKPYT